MSERRVNLVGIGPGSPELLTAQAAQALSRCDCLIGASRMLENLSSDAPRYASSSTAEILSFLRAHPEYSQVAIAVSGDVGFHSLTKGILPLLKQEDYEVACLPAVGTLSYFCARLGISWEDVRVLSLHGREGALLSTVLFNRRTFVLTDSKNSPETICHSLLEAGLEDVLVSVGEHLSYAQERIVQGTPKELSSCSFGSLSVLLVENQHPLQVTATQGLPDEWFCRGSKADGRIIPMTKSEVRSIILSKLRLQRNDTVYDIGAGTGSVAVEMALRVTEGRVIAIEQERDAVALIAKNRLRFGVLHLEICQGRAPQALEGLPVPDAVFVGGSTGDLAGILELVYTRNLNLRLVVSAITLETLHQAVEWMESHEILDVEVVSLSVSKARRVGRNHLMQAQNPIYLISGGGATDER